MSYTLPTGKNVGHPVSTKRVQAVLSAFHRGCKCLNDVEKMTGFCRSSIHYAVERLLHRKLLEVCGTQESNCGRASSVYRIAGTNPLPVRSETSRSHPKPAAPKYHGKPAGRITIPQYNWAGTRMG